MATSPADTCQPAPWPEERSVHSTPSRVDQNRRARSASSAGNSIKANGPLMRLLMRSTITVLPQPRNFGEDCVSLPFLGQHLVRAQDAHPGAPSARTKGLD